MKKKIKNFLSNNCITVPMFISLFCVAIWDSTIALVIYAAIMHFLLLFLIVGSYCPDIVKKPTTKLSIKNVLSVIGYTSIITIILVITKHWYTLCVSLSCIFLVCAYLYDWAKDEPTE